MTQPSAIPLPKDPRHQRFADRVLAGDSLTDAYLTAGYKASRDAARKNAKRLRDRTDVTAYIEAVQQQAAEGAVASLRYKREFLFQIMDTPLMDIDPHDPERKHGRLLKKYKRSASETGESEEIEKLDPLKAIALDNELAGHKAPEKHEHTTDDALGAILADIAANAHTAPRERL